MRLGRRLALPAVALAVVAAPTLVGCGLFDAGSEVEEAFEYLPADTFSVRFVDRAAMAEHLGVDDVDPRGVSDSDINDYAEPQLTEHAPVATAITLHADAMKDAPINDFDIEWEAEASWGDDPARPAGSAYVWKVGEDVDFDDLADDGGMDDLLGAAEGDPGPALLRTGDVCRDLGGLLPKRILATYEDLGRPDARALFITVADDPEVLLALQYTSEDAAEDDLELREALVEDGVEPQTRRPFDDLGVFELERDGEFVLIEEEELDGGTSQAVQAEQDGGGPGFCVPDEHGAVNRGA